MANTPIVPLSRLDAEVRSKRNFLKGDGEVRQWLPVGDWATSAFGPVSSWTPSLRTVTEICLTAHFPMVLWWGADFCLIYNDAAAPLLGDKHPAALGQKGQTGWPRGWAILRPLLDQVRQTGETLWVENLGLSLVRQGVCTEGTFTCSLSPILDEASQVAGVVMVIRETRAPVLGEQQLRTENLDGILSHVTNMLESLQEGLRPLDRQWLKPFVHLLALQTQGTREASAEAFLTFITDATQRMQEQLQALLTYLHVEGQGEEVATVDCEGLLTQVLNDLEPAITERAAEITHDRLPLVQGEARHLGWVFHNLVSTALKLREPVPARMHVSARWHDGRWIFAICDCGGDIDPQHASQISQFFQQLHTDDEYPGTELRLAICKRIIERHQGQIWIESEVGKGTTLCFSLPAIQAASKEPS